MNSSHLLATLSAAVAVAIVIAARQRRRPTKREVLLRRALQLLCEEDNRTAPPMPTPALTPMIPGVLPACGLGPEKALEVMAPVALKGAAGLGHPAYFAHMDPASEDIASAVGLWQIVRNQNMLHPDAAPTAREAAVRVIEWLAPFFGMNGGHLVPGSTVANLTALWVARELRGVRRVIASDRSHNSIRKACNLLGLAYVELPANPKTHRLDVSLHAQDLSDAAVVLTAGTVATGAVDVLSPRPAEAAWVHVDAAWAGPARLSPALARLLDGVDQCDSVGFSAHKWLYQPKGCGVILFRDSEAAHAAISYGGGYLATPTIGVVGSAPAAALPLMATLLAWGHDGLIQRLQDDVAAAHHLAELVRRSGRFELWGDDDDTRACTDRCLGVVCWRPRDTSISAAAVRARLHDSWVSLTMIDGTPWFRCVAANPRAKPELVVQSVVNALDQLVPSGGVG